MLVNLILLFIAYLLGSIPSGLWIGQTFFNINIREHGSGNTGTTNTFRILGSKAGTIVFVIDFLKGTVAALLPLIFHAQGISPIVFGLMAVLGHTFPIFAQFKGGKAVATSAGMLMGFAPAFCLYLVLIFASSLYLTSMVSFSSVLAAALAILGALLFPAIGIILPSYDWLSTVIIVFLGSFVIIRHKENIQRILKKEENLVPFGLNLTKQKKGAGKNSTGQKKSSSSRPRTVD
ncbi:TPA: glycerol-3-phosphate 1-O-acyltransferase PlsY [Streptococcus suis]